MKFVALIALAMVIAAGCGDASGSSSSSTSVAPSTAPSVVASAAASAAPSGSAPGGSDGPDALPHDDPGLEARLPSVVNNSPLTVFSVGPLTVAGNPGADPIKNLAKELGDGSGNFGLAFANDPRAQTFNIFALRVPGATSGELLDRYGQLTVADTAGATSDTVTLSAKEVLHVTSPGNEIGDVWIYATGDTVFGVQAGSADQAAELLALLP